MHWTKWLRFNAPVEIHGHINPHSKDAIADKSAGKVQNDKLMPGWISWLECISKGPLNLLLHLSSAYFKRDDLEIEMHNFSFTSNEDLK